MVKSRYLATSAGVGVAALGLMAAPAFAQISDTAGASGQQAAGSGADQSAIVVTGTRIKRPDLASNSPIIAVPASEIRYQGATSVESVLNRLPQFTADANENVSNGSDGTSNINLRNLGSNRVLTLINGQRMLPAQAVDINFVPAFLVQRIDVVTGGASAVYGSDALSGVVNFVLRDDLDGFRIDAQSTIAGHQNGNTYIRDIIAARGYQNAGDGFDAAKQDASVAFGKNFGDGRGNVTIYGGYRHYAPLLQSQRDVSACALQNADAAGTALACGGSSNTPYGTFIPLGGPNQSKTLTNAMDGSRTWVPYTSAFTYNYAPLNYIQRSDDRYTAGAFAKYKFSDAAEFYGSFMYMNDRTFSQVAPSALFLGTTFTVPCNNPLMSASQQQALCGATAGTSATQDTLIGFRLGGNGTLPRRDNLRHEDWRYTAGLRGDLGHGFSYDVSAMRALVRYDETYLNNVDAVKAQNALNVVNVNGTPTCQSVIDKSDPACIPVNVFQANGIDAAQAGYLYSPSNTHSRNTLTVFNGSISGDLGTFGIKSPWANRGVAIVLGAERRRETLNYTVDAIALQGGAAPSDGIIAVNEGFGEIEVPILQDLPFAKALTFNGGVRYSSYSNHQNSSGLSSGYNVWTYKGEVSWQPIDDIRLRASYNRAIRAPNVGELFGATTVGNVAAQDPCAGSGSDRPSLAVCQLTGVTADQYNAGTVIACPADTCNAQGGGNRNLKPETGDTYTVGAVLMPHAIRNLSLSVDYYHIKIKDYIGILGTTTIITQCIQTGDPYYCSLFHRDPRTGALFGQNSGYVIDTTRNTGFLRTSGIDVTTDYTFDLGGAGKLNLNLVGTYVLQQVSQPIPGAGTYDCNGYFGFTCGQPNPKWRSTVRATYTTRIGASLSLAWRYIDSVKLSTLSSNPFLAGDPSIINRRIKAYNYFDLAALVPVGKKFSLRMGVNNFLDKDPPAIAAGTLQVFGNGNTYPGFYDVIGRTFFAGFTAEF